ncbi:MAG: Co2+/Mg2+ efflux protein ApaG [Myxococcales bacterium]
MSTATTQGIRVTVKTQYLADRSQNGRFAFAYHIRIENLGDQPAKLKTRHWIITDGNGEVEEVKGDGVVGEQPRLEPGQSFEYTSGCVLKTPHGVMQGTYQMYRDDGSHFDAVIAPFSLTMPNALN